MNQDQARRLAEELLSDEEIDAIVYAQCPDFDEAHEGPSIDDMCAVAVEAIASALVKLTQQEPIVWGYRTKSGLFDCISNEEHARAPGDYDIPLYTTPPAQPARECVGLTDEMSAEELLLFESTMSDFDDCGETSTPNETLMDWARRGYLDCVRYETTKKANELIEKNGGAA